ncbi:hypothetical protein ACP4OV_022126 [Aristida adscensionis]
MVMSSSSPLQLALVLALLLLSSSPYSLEAYRVPQDQEGARAAVFDGGNGRHRQLQQYGARRLLAGFRNTPPPPAPGGSPPVGTMPVVPVMPPPPPPPPPPLKPDV